MPDRMADITTLLAFAAAIGGIGYWIGLVNSDRKSFKAFMADIRGEIRTIHGDIRTIQEDISTIRGDVTTIRGDISTIRGDIRTIPKDIRTT